MKKKKNLRAEVDTRSMKFLLTDSNEIIEVTAKILKILLYMRCRIFLFRIKIFFKLANILLTGYLITRMIIHFSDSWCACAYVWFCVEEIRALVKRALTNAQNLRTQGKNEKI